MFKWSSSDKIAIPILLLSVILISILLHFLLKNKSEKVKRIPLIVISLLLIILEVAKQIYFFANGVYTVKQLPAHFCSLIVVIIALSEFLPKKLSKYLEVPSVVFPIMTILLVLVHPNSMIGNSSSAIFKDFPNFHAFMFHALVIAYPIIKITLVKFNLKLKYCFSLICCILFYISYAIPIAFINDCNYLNILWNVFEPLEKFRVKYGQVCYEIVWFLICVAISIVVYLIWYYIDKFIEKRRNRNAT